jgi:hypothetical protein
MGALISIILIVAAIGAFAYLGQESLPDCILDQTTHKYVMKNSDGKTCMLDYTGTIAQYDSPQKCGEARLDSDNICTTWGLTSGIDGHTCQLQSSGKYRLIDKDGKYCASDFVDGAKEMTAAECNAAILDPTSACEEFGWGPGNGYGPLHCVSVGGGSYNMVNQKDSTTCLSDMLGSVMHMTASDCSAKLKSPPCIAWGTPGVPSTYQGRYAAGSTNSWTLKTTDGKTCYQDYIGTPWVVNDVNANNAVLTGACPIEYATLGYAHNPGGYFCARSSIAGKFLPTNSTGQHCSGPVSPTDCNNLMLRQAVSC